MTIKIASPPVHTNIYMLRIIIIFLNKLYNAQSKCYYNNNNNNNNNESVNHSIDDEKINTIIIYIVWR